MKTFEFAFGTSNKPCTRSYRYGFNGKESLPELSNFTFDLGERHYDSRLGRMLKLDPLMSSYPYWSPYSYCGNNPICLVDKNGMGPGPHDGTDKHIVKSGETLWEIAKNSYATYGKPYGMTFEKYWESIKSWNKNVNYSKVGASVNLEDPNKSEELKKKERADFESFPDVKHTSTGNNDNKSNYNIKTVNTFSELLWESYFDLEVGIFDGELLSNLKSDRNLDLIREDVQDHFDEIVNKGYYFKTINAFTFGNSNTAVGAFNPNAWSIRHGTVKYWATIQGGSITIEYNVNDIFDLVPSRSWGKPKGFAYNYIVTTMGLYHHTLLGGNKNLQTRASWIETIDRY